MAFYKAYYDDALSLVKNAHPNKKTRGVDILMEIPDSDVRRAVADTLFRHGRGGGAKNIQEALNKVGKKVAVDEPVGPETFKALQDVANNPKQAKTYLEILAAQRSAERKTEGTRNNIFLWE